MQNKEIDIKKENDKKKGYLWGYRDASRQLKRLEEELMELRLNIRCPSVNQDGMPHGSGGSDLSGYMSKVDELERKILKARYKKIQKFKEIRDRIERLEDENEKDILFYKYIKSMTFEKIAVKMDMSWRNVIRIHGKALTNFNIS